MGHKNFRRTLKKRRTALCHNYHHVQKEKGQEAEKLWCKKWLENGTSLESHVTFLCELKMAITVTNHHMPMDLDTFYRLLAKVQPLITKQDTNMRNTIYA